MLGKEERLDVQSGGAADGDSVEVGGDLVARGGQICRWLLEVAIGRT